MASLFGHAAVAAALVGTKESKSSPLRLWVLAIVCALLPDADVIMFRLGIPYHHPLGHRGFSHSLVFALALAVLVTVLFFRELRWGSVRWWGMVLLFFLATASHGLLDGMTNGGLGVAYFAPFDNRRYFLPFRPILVSPIGIKAFLSRWGWFVIRSELVWIGIPCFICWSTARVFWWAARIR